MGETGLCVGDRPTLGHSDLTFGPYILLDGDCCILGTLLFGDMLASHGSLKGVLWNWWSTSHVEGVLWELGGDSVSLVCLACHEADGGQVGIHSAGPPKIHGDVRVRKVTSQPGGKRWAVQFIVWETG